MRAFTTTGAIFLLAARLGAALVGRGRAAPQKKEYLSDAEADKIRDAGATGPRIVLFATLRRTASRNSNMNSRTSIPRTKSAPTA